jgi:ABC-type nitrate/sulfonate/bicarbonate transport system ATPase subunit
MIQLNNLSVGYDIDKPVMHDLNNKFDNNNIYGILGKSGRGKTTLLRTISGLIKPLKGSVMKDRNEVTSPYKSGIFMMHQGYTNFDWLKCIDNILIARSVNDKITSKDIDEAYDLLKEVGLDKYSKSYPAELSGGMQQRLALARMLYAKPDIMLLDEPLSALDEATRKNMQNLIVEFHKVSKNLILMVTHSSDEAERMCDYIIKF